MRRVGNGRNENLNSMNTNIVDGSSVFDLKSFHLCDAFENAAFRKCWGTQYLSQFDTYAFDDDDAAPFGSARPFSAIIIHHLIRRRDLRSDLVLMRRSIFKLSQDVA